MSIIVQKYGGSAVADEHALTCVIEPETVEPAVELLNERLALAEAS